MKIDELVTPQEKNDWNKMHMLMFNDTENVSGKLEHPFMIKKLSTRNRRKVLQQNKSHI